ncbi:MAG: hypothetical protein H0T79_16850 [Deltaproteobacteria bacterium]|nr:hypothetical protein [Deltaproteobacteria bacterium]
MKKLCLIALVSACAQTDSSDALTSGMYAQLGATSTGGDTTSVHATLFFGNPINLNFVNLTGDDELMATHGGQDKVMIESELLNIVSHRAEFVGDNEEGAEFEIAFLRTVDAGAPLSIATLPAKFAIDAPPTTSSRAAALTVTWSPSGTADQMTWTAKGECIEDAQGSVPGDPGTVSVLANALVKRQGVVADTCGVNFELTRARAGVLDTHYGKGGIISGQQVRSVTFSSTP